MRASRVGVAIAIGVIITHSILSTCNAQTLNEAVNNQLAIGQVVGIECEQLLNGDPTQVAALVGPLRTICTRGFPAPGAGPSTSTGGGAATPTTLPSVVQQRLRERHPQRERRTEKEPYSGGASADAVSQATNRLSFFIGAEYEVLDRELTTYEDGFDSDLWRVAAGIDYQFSDRTVAGLALDYYRQDGQFDGGGGFDNNSYGALVYGVSSPFDQAYLQLWAGYAENGYQRDRIAAFTQYDANGNVDFSTSAFGSVISADYHGHEVRAGGLAGYGFAVRNVVIGPWLGLDYFRIGFDKYSETGSTGLELTFYDETVTSLQSKVGLQATVTLNTPSWVIEPVASISWIHEFENDQRTIEVSFVDDTRAQRFGYLTDSPDRDWGALNLGVVGTLNNRMQAFVNYRAIFGNSMYDNQAIVVGMRVPF